MQRLSHAQNRGAARVLSKQHASKILESTGCQSAIPVRLGPSAACRRHSTPLQPVLRRVFLRRNFLGSFQQGLVQRFFTARVRQLPGKALGKTIPKIDMLYAALMQQTGARAALCGTSNLAAIDHHVRRHRIGETQVSAVATALWAVLARWPLRRRTRHRRVATGRGVVATVCSRRTFAVGDRGFGCRR